MPYKAPFIKFTWGGPMFVDEEWTNGINFFETEDAEPGSIRDAFTLTNLQGVLSEASTIHTSINGSNSNVLLQWGKFALIGTDGKYLEDAIIQDYNPANPGGGPSVGPPTSSAAISFKTGKRTGPGSNGRIYPPVNAEVGGNGRISDTRCQNLADRWAQGIGEMNRVFQEDMGLHVIVAGVVSKVGNGTNEEITTVRVGNLLDNQRSRKNQLDEKYYSEAV